MVNANWAWFLVIFCFVILLPKSYPGGGGMMRGDLLGLVKSTSAFKDLGAVSTHYLLTPLSALFDLSKEHTLGAGQEHGASRCQKGD